MDSILPALLTMAALLVIPAGFFFVWLDAREGRKADQLESDRIARDWAAKNR